MVRFCLGLKKIDNFYKRKEIHALEGIHGTGMSKLQHDHDANHPSEVDNYFVESTVDGFIVTKNTEDGIGQCTYHLAKNRFLCNSTLCKVICNKCPSPKVCSHIYTCDCSRFSYGNLCKHTHLLSLLNRLPPPIEEQTDDTQLFHRERHHLEGDGLEHCEDTDIIVERQLDEEEVEFIENARKIEEKAKKVRELMASKLIPKEVKRKLNSDLQTVPLCKIVVQGLNNPTSFPKLDRKRSHEPQTRSYFPTKKKRISISRSNFLNE